MTRIDNESSLKIYNLWIETKKITHIFRYSSIVIIDGMVAEGFWCVWRSISSLPNVKYLVIIENKSVDYIPECPNLIILNIEGCYNIRNLPEKLDKLTHLNINGCLRIKNIPNYPKINTLSCNSCYELITILSKPIKLFANFCRNIKTLSVNTNTNEIHITGCINLKYIYDISNTVNINTYENINIKVSGSGITKFAELNNSPKPSYINETENLVSQISYTNLNNVK